jgi:hypothetical protein
MIQSKPLELWVGSALWTNTVKIYQIQSVDQQVWKKHYNYGILDGNYYAPYSINQFQSRGKIQYLLRALNNQNLFLFASILDCAGMSVHRGRKASEG